MAAVVPPAALVMPIVPEIIQICQIMTWTGFDNKLQRESIINDAFMSYNNIQTLTVKDILGLSDAIRSRTANNKRINYGIQHTENLKSMVH